MVVCRSNRICCCAVQIHSMKGYCQPPLAVPDTPSGNEVRRRWRATLLRTSRKLYKFLVDFHESEIRRLEVNIRLLESRLRTRDTDFDTALATIKRVYDDITARHLQRKHRKVYALLSQRPRPEPHLPPSLPRRLGPQPTDPTTEAMTDTQE